MVEEPLTAVGERLRARGRTFEVRGGSMLVLGSGVAQRVEDVNHAYARAVAAGATPHQAADAVLAILEAQEHRLDADVGEGRVRLRVTHPAELDPAYTLPGPAGLIVYPVLDEPHAATRLGPAQVTARGGLERVCVEALAPTLAEPVQVEPMPGGAGWRVTGDIYTASRVLDVARLVGEIGGDPRSPHVVALPASREMWVLPEVPDARWWQWVNAQAAAAYANSRGRVSRLVYRWDGAALRELDQPASSDIGP